MLWKDLSNDAKNILEWIENPFTGKRKELSIRVGEDFFIKCPGTSVMIPITESLYNEIRNWVINDEELTYEEEDGCLRFRIRESSSLKLH